jgi:hypothetical protein|nr:MAG TPA: hypothetical protein [Caudoviricetes sp.]
MNFDSLSIGEVIELEDMAGIPLAQIGDDKPVGRVLRALVYIMMKRSGREMSVAEIDALPVSETEAILAPLKGDTPPM